MEGEGELLGVVAEAFGLPVSVPGKQIGGGRVGIL